MSQVVLLALRNLSIIVIFGENRFKRIFGKVQGRDGAKTKTAPRLPGAPLHENDPHLLHHLAHASAGVVTDTGACRLAASLLARFLVITVITELFEQPFLVHDLLQALERTLDRLALLQSELNHACHPLSKPSVSRQNRTCVRSPYRSGQK